MVVIQDIQEKKKNIKKEEAVFETIFKSVYKVSYMNRDLPEY